MLKPEFIFKTSSFWYSSWEYVQLQEKSETGAFLSDAANLWSDDLEI